MSYLQHLKLKDEEFSSESEANCCPECGDKIDFWRFQTDDGQWVDECVKCRHTKWWCDKDDKQSQADYKNSLKNDY